MRIRIIKIILLTTYKYC